MESVWEKITSLFFFFWRHTKSVWKEIKSFFFFFVSYWISVSIGFLVAVAFALFEQYNKPKFHWATTAFFVLLAAVVAEVLITYVREGKNRETLELFRKALVDIPKPLKKYTETRLDSYLRAVQTEIMQLQSTGLPQKSTSDKIHIISSLLLSNASKGGEARYWATTLDSPSMIYEIYPAFFEAQQDLLTCKDKRRLVVIEASALDREITDPQSRQFLIQFIDWHLSKTNSFALKFHIGTIENFSKRADQFIASQTSSEVVVDFAIFSDQWVFGEVDYKPDGLDEQTRQLRLYKKQFGFGGAFHEYESFYLSIWNHWDFGKWPVLNAKQVRSECMRHTKKESAASSLAIEYPTLAMKTGTDFFKEVCSHICAAKERIMAVDIAPMKTDLNDWLNRPEYSAFLKATIDSVTLTKTCSARRVHVVQKPTHDDGDLVDQYKNIFKKQMDAGITIFLVNMQSLFEVDLPVHDFIIADNMIFGLGWNEDFSAEKLSPAKNLDSFANIEWYLHIFNQIIKAKCTRPINDLSQAAIMDFLRTLSW